MCCHSKVGGALSTKYTPASMENLLVNCPGINASYPAGHGPTKAGAPCADDPRIVYRPKDDTYYLTYNYDAGPIWPPPGPSPLVCGMFPKRACTGMCCMGQLVTLVASIGAGHAPTGACYMR